MKQEIRDTIKTAIINEIGNEYSDLTYGCLDMIAENVVDAMVESARIRAKLEAERIRKNGL